MSKLTQYIENLKEEIQNLGDTNEVEIIRYVYISLGKLMNFDLNYTFGNKNERIKIYKKVMTEKELNSIFERREAICKSLAYLLKRVLGEFNINTRVVGDNSDSYDIRVKPEHVYNIVKLQNGEEYSLDLEEDLEFIQTGSKTVAFGNPIDSKNKPMVTDEELRKIDQTKVKYIPEGYYFDDMIGMLKLAISSPALSIDEKVNMVLKNLHVYKDNTKIEYRERVFYLERVIEKLFDLLEKNKISIIDCYRKEDDKKVYNDCVIVQTKKEPKFYMFSNEKFEYEEISVERLISMLDNGLKTRQEIPGIRNILRKYKQEKSRE